MISCGTEVIARHRRSYDSEVLIFDPLHYLPLIEQKIGALDQAAPLAGWDLPEAFITLSKTGAELLFEVFSQRYERGSTLVTTNLPFDEWTEVFGSERLTGALLDHLTHHVNILEMNGESYRLNQKPQASNPDGE